MMHTELPSLRDAYKKYFKIGAAVSPWDFARFGDILSQHFNSLTCGNAMKFEPLQPRKGVWNFEAADEVVAYAKANDMVVRAHAPVWHKQTGLWIFQDESGNPISREALLERLEAHMQVFGQRYGKDITCWDVVNEGIAHIGGGVLRESDWYRLVGPDYIHEAFKIAARCVPENVQLFFNEYNEWMPHKREKILTLIRDLQDKGIPIHGLGMQQHLSIYADMDEIRRTFEEFAKLGLRLHVTELDISLFNVYETGRQSITDAMLKRQYDMYVELFSIYRQYADHLDSVTTWGISDAATWLNASAARIGDLQPPNLPRRYNFPLLFYADHRMRLYTQKIIEDAIKA